MATSGNGTFIPMVSASPPPMDDVAFDFDDDDDEFSNFSSAPIGLDSPPGKWVGTKKGSFEPIRSDPTDPFHPTDDSHPSNNDEDFEAFAAFGSSSSSHDKQNSNDRLVTNNNIRGHSMNGNESNEEDEFADFAAFQNDPVGESNKYDGSYLDNGRQSEVSSSVVLNKNNSHENCESHNAHYPQIIGKLDKDLDKVLHSDDSTAGMSPHSETPHAGTKAVYQNEGGMLSDIQSRIPSQSSLDYPEPAHEHNNTMGDNDESEDTRRESVSSAAQLEKPSTGSLSLIKESDRQTFDSGIDSIMTPSDSSPEGKDDCSENVISEEDSNSRSSDNGPNTANDDEWGDFDTFSSTGSHTKHSGGMNRAEPTDTVSPVAEDSSINDQESNDFGEFGSVARTQQQPANSDNTGKGVLSNSESLHKSDSGNITNSLSTPQHKTTVQCDDDDDDDDFGDFGNAKQESTDNVIPSSKQDDDFDDFGDFSSTKSMSEHEVSKQIQDKSDGDWGKSNGDKTPAPAVAAAEDFGEFGSFGSNPGSMFGSTEDSKDDDEFGTFSSTGGSALGQDDTKSDDFGSFGSSRTVSGSLDSTGIQSGTGSVFSKVPPGGRVERLFKSCFPGSVAAGTLTNQPVQVLQDIVTVKEPVPAKAKGEKSSASNGMVWLSLSDMENTMAQKYHWNDSKNSGKLHLSLGIDSRNILPPGRGGRPLFAQELGMLTPSKPGEGSDKIPLGGAASDVSSVGAEDAGVSTNSSGTEDTVPKAEFDWSNSGLINPLDANSLNLDFFANERKSSSSRHKSRSVQKVDPELLDLAVSPSDPPLKPALTPSSSSSNQSSSSSSSQKKSPTALDEILKHSSSSMVKQKPKRETGLSSEANSVLDSFPDLSYMLAKVLMFPVASSNSSSPSKPAKSDVVPSTGWAESIS